MKYLLLILLSFNVYAEGFPEDKLTKNLMIGANALIVADWAQTRYIAENPDRFHETGIAEYFIGKHPSTKEVNQYFISSIISANLIGYYLPGDYKKWWWGWIVVYEFDVVNHNRKIGVKFEF